MTRRPSLFRRHRAARLVLITLLGGALLWWTVHLLAERAVRRAIDRFAQAHEARWVRDDAEMDISLLHGDLLLCHLDLVPRQAGDTGLAGHVDTVQVEGFSIARALMGRGLYAQRLVFIGQGLRWRIRPTTGTGQDGGGERFAVEEVRIRLSDVALNLPDSGSSSCASLALDIHGLDAEPSGKQLVIADWALAARTLHWTGPGDGPLRIALLEKPTGQDELVIKDVLLGDTATTIAAARALPLERDVITGWMKEVRLSGVDPAGLFRGPQRVPRVVLGPSGLVVARDKTLPDRPWRYRPLPARLLRALPVGCGIDTVVLEGLDVTYHDRADAERPFAHLKFHSIAGRVMHLSHSPGDSLVVEATCTFGRRTPIHLHLTTAIDDTTDVMDVQAQAGAMTFRELGPAMAALAGIGAEEGRLDTLIMKLRADDRRADGRLLARYEDLRLERKSGRARVLDPLFNAVINAVVRTDRTGERSDDGWVRYSVDRRRDRAVFNYLWSGVREGMKASVLPEVVQKR